MGLRQTSLLAYLDMNYSGKIGKNQAAVLRVIEDKWPITNRGIAEELDWPINTVTPRCLELRAQGRVKQAKKDIENNRLVIFWKPTKIEREYENE